MISLSHRQSFMALIFTMEGSVVPAIMPKIFAATIIGVFAELIYNGYLGDSVRKATSYSFLPFTALGVAISLFLGFHNNASYSRWWEARILWGNQIIVVRTLIRFLLGTCRCPHHYGSDHIETHIPIQLKSIHTLEMIEACPNNNNNINNDNLLLNRGSAVNIPNTNWRAHIIQLAMAQTHALRSQLRPSCRADTPLTAAQDRDRFLTNEERQNLTRSPNPASAILLKAATILGEESGLPEFSKIHASQILDRLGDIQTACERIQNTTIPFAYSLLVHRTSTIYVILAPFAMASTMSWWTPVFTALLAYAFFGLDELSRQVQEPFGDEPQCLALSAMCRTVEIDVCEALSLEIPPTLKPKKNVLM